jgi:hypothetical protein
MPADIAAERARMLEELYAVYGIDASFTPAGGGAALPVRVRPARPREEVPLGELGVEAEKRRLRVRVSEIGLASPRKGTLVVDGETLRVKRAPLDDHRQEYTLGLEVVTA